MDVHQLTLILVIVVLTLISGLADAQGFTHASNAWLNGNIVWSEALKALLGFGIGAICYLIVANYLKQAGIASTEMQTLIWFAVTMMGVALISGKILRWQRPDQVVAILAIVCIGWLVVRTSG